MPVESVQQRLRGMTPAISVGMLTADMMALGKEVRLLEEAGVRLLHFDVMDGCFCPMMTFGPPLIKGIRTSLLKDVHLMIKEPLDKLAAYAAAGADMVTVHIEACSHPHRALQAIGELPRAGEPGGRVMRGLALNPGTPVEAVGTLLEETDMVTLLAVNPGWSGQKFIGTTSARIAALSELIRRSGRNVLIGLDGGITKANIREVARMGADIVVTGSAVFDGGDAAANAREMMAAMAQSRSV